MDALVPTLDDLLDRTVVACRRQMGIIEISGAQRLDLLDRMSTQKLRDLQVGEGTATILTTEIGRIIDRLIVYADEDRLTVLTGADFATGIIGYLIRFVFFNDDFHMNDRTADVIPVAVYGATAASALRAAGIECDEIPLHHWRSTSIGGSAVTIHRTDPVGTDGYLMLVATDELDAVERQLADAGILLIGPEQFEELRVAAAVPLLGRELTPDYIPLETGLWDDVSFNKGCYIGQEIIARMESRGKLAKQLVRFAADQPLPMGDVVTADMKAAGIITSASGRVGLGYIKTTYLDSDLSINDIPLRIRKLQ